MKKREVIFEKRNYFDNKVILIDGLWGSGKSLLGPIISGMDGVETPNINYDFEKISILFNKNKISEDVAELLFKTSLDELIYHQLLGRNINFRLYDDSGTYNNSSFFREIKKLFIKDLNLESENFKNAIITLMTHMLLISSKETFNFNRKNVKMIQVVRHPLYVFDHWKSYFERFDNPKILSFSTYYNDIKIPWFAESWEKEFSNSNIYDRTLLSIIFCYELLFKKYNLYNYNNTNDILFLNFESIIFDTELVLKRISNFIGSAQSKNVTRILKKQKIPRKTILSGKGQIKYGWTEGLKNEREDYYILYKKIELNSNKSHFNKFKILIKNYNKYFPSKLGNFV